MTRWNLTRLQWQRLSNLPTFPPAARDKLRIAVLNPRNAIGALVALPSPVEVIEEFCSIAGNEALKGNRAMRGVYHALRTQIESYHHERSERDVVNSDELHDMIAVAESESMREYVPQQPKAKEEKRSPQLEMFA